jgi:hypothetical protein
MASRHHPRSKPFTILSSFSLVTRGDFIDKITSQ